jgi:phosphate-selective porin OprO/OprP
MKHFKRTALVSVINLALFGIPDAHADTATLERRIRELESRLEKLDQSGALALKPALVASTQAPEVDKLTKKVNTLERKLEVQNETTASTFKSLPVFEAGADGFKVSSSNKEHLLRIGGTLQADGRFFLTQAGSFTGQNPIGSTTTSDAFLIRQARLLLDGKAFKDLNYRVLADFANSNLLPDAYLDYTYHPSASLLVGKFRPSVSLERLQGDGDTAFLERGLTSNLAPNRDVGVQLHGGFSKPGYQATKVAGAIDSVNTFTYQLGVSNGNGDSGNTTTTATDTDSNKEFVGRVFAQPFQHSGYHWLEGFGLGVAGTFANPNRQTPNAQKTALGQNTFLDYTTSASGGGARSASGTVTSTGASSRIYPQAYWYAGPFGLLGEYVASTQHLAGSSLAANNANNNVKQTNKAAQIQASYVLTGEDVTFNGVKPLQNFDPSKGTWGALQLVSRWNQLSVDDDTFKLLDPSKSASQVTAWAIGANWYLNKNAIIKADFENVNFNGGAGSTTKVTDRATEKVFATRFQLAF